MTGLRGVQDLRLGMRESAPAEQAEPLSRRIAVPIGEHRLAREATLVHPLGPIGSGDGRGMGEDENPTRIETPSDQRKQPHRIGEPHSPEDRADGVIRLRTVPQMIERPGTDEPRSGIPPTLPDTPDHDGGEINSGRLHTPLSEKGHRPPGATPDLERGPGLPQQLNSRPMPGVLSPPKNGLAVEHIAPGAALGIRIPQLTLHVHVMPCCQRASSARRLKSQGCARPHGTAESTCAQAPSTGDGASRRRTAWASYSSRI